MTIKEEDNDNLVLQKQANMYMERDMLVAVELINEFRYTGKIFSVSSDFLELDDWKTNEVIPLFFKQIKVIAPIPSKRKEKSE